MIGSLHWSLITLLELCFGCALLNYVQWRATGTVRVVGALICTGWAIQQTAWVVTGGANLLLELTCDVFILSYLWKRRGANTKADWWIFAMIPATMAIYIPAALYGPTWEGWWANRIIVAIQMMLGMPTPWRQKIGGSVSHGSVKHGSA